MRAACTPVGGSSDDSNGDRQWYVLKTKPRAERQAVYALTARQLMVYLPLLKRQHRFEPLFSGYLFLRMNCNTEEYLRSRSAPGVAYIVSADGVPIPVTEALVEEIRHRVDTENNLDPAARFAPCERVVITAGPFRDMEAIFDRTLTQKGRSLVLMRILGRLARVQVDVECLVKLRA